MDIHKDNEDYENQNIPKATKSSIEMDLSAIDTESKINCGSSDSDEDYNDLDNQKANKLPIDMDLSLVDKTPNRLSVLTSAYPSKGLSINIKWNKKRRAEASGAVNYEKLAKSSSCNGLSTIDSENWYDSSYDSQFTTSQAEKSRSVSDSDDFNTTINNTEKPEILTKSISDLTDEQESMESDDVISDEEQTSEELESEEEERLEDIQSGSSPKETDESEEMRFLLSNFTDEQYDRYEAYKRSTFPKMKIQSIIDRVAGYSVSHNVVIAMAGIAKSFVGDIIEKGLDIQDKQGDNTGPLHPRQIREAVRQLRRQGKILCSDSNLSKFNKHPPNM